MKKGQSGAGGRSTPIMGAGRWGRCLWGGACFLLLAAELPAAEKNPVSLDLRSDFYSAYIWRGRALDKHGVAQPSVIATYDAKDIGLFSAKIWSNWDLSQRSGDSKATRTGGGINVLSFTPSYRKALGPVDFTLGNTWYVFPGDGFPEYSRSTPELFVILAYPNRWVTPSLSVWYDYGHVGDAFLEDNPLKDLYGRAALDKSVVLTDRLRAGGTVLIAAGSSHYNNVRYCGSEEGFADYLMSVNLTYAVTDAFSVGGSLDYVGLIGGAWGLDRHAISPDEMLRGGIHLRLLF
ncbi:MAG: hypothetical protein RBT78_12750 [Kiritimatiellia bacterium]|nr:hypothetical protein [Kiritimatiellia bacterium]